MEQPHGRRCYSLTKGELDSSPAPNKGAKGMRIYNTSVRSSCATPWTPTQSSQVFRALPHWWHRQPLTKNFTHPYRNATQLQSAIRSN